MSPRIDEAAHPDHALFKQALMQVHTLDASVHRQPDEGSHNLAGALAVEAKAGELRGIKALVLNDDGRRVFAVDTADLSDVFKRHVNLDIGPAMRQSIAESTNAMARLNESVQQHAPLQEQQPIQQVAELSAATPSGPRIA